MEIKAISKNVQISPRKARLAAQGLSSLPVKEALERLSVTGKRGSLFVEKTLKSAVANAVSNAGLSKDILVVKNIQISEGFSLKRFHPTSRGRVHPYKRKRSHITVVLSDGASGKKPEEQKIAVKAASVAKGKKTKAKTVKERREDGPKS